MFPLYDDKNKKIFFWSFKCCSTYIKNIYYNHYLNLNYKKNTIKIISLLNRYKTIDEKKLSEYEKIFICRNPYSRIVSCFIDKYIDGRFSYIFKLNIYIRNFFNYLFGREYIGLTFEEFVNLVYEQFVLSKYNFLEFDHLTPQFSVNFYNNFKFDKIYKLEDLNDSLFLKNEFNLDINNVNLFSNYNCSISYYFIKNAYKLDYDQLSILKKNKKIPRYYCFYNNDIKAKINILYRSDFINLSNHNIFYNY